MKPVQRNTFSHVERDCGYATRCHIPVRPDGKEYQKNHNGYSRILLHIEGAWRMRFAHRFRLQELGVKIKAGMVCDHLCRVRACCNPGHIEITTPQVNSIRGNAAKLDFDDIDELRRRVLSGEVRMKVAASMGVSPATVTRVMKGVC